MCFHFSGILLNLLLGLNLSNVNFRDISCGLNFAGRKFFNISCGLSFAKKFKTAKLNDCRYIQLNMQELKSKEDDETILECVHFYFALKLK